MRREVIDNPECEGLKIQRIDYRPWPQVQADWDLTIPDTIPPGFEPYVKRVGGVFEYGVRKISGMPEKAQEVKSGTNFDKMSEPELKTWAGQHGVKYDDKPERGVLLARVKAKAATK